MWGNYNFPSVSMKIEKLKQLIQTAEVADRNLESLEDEIAVLYSPHREILQTLIDRELKVC